MTTLFGESSGTAVVDLPCRLDSFEPVSGGRTDLCGDRLIDKHTLFPLYSPFLPAARAAQIREAMKNRGGNGVHLRIGAMAGAAVSPQFMRFCPGCDADDIAAYGHTFWHRLHQIAGVEVCPRHSMFLLDSGARRRHRQTRHEFVASDCASKPRFVRSLDATNPDHLALRRIAQRAEWLLDDTVAPSKLNWHENYSGLLHGRGLASSTGRIRFSKLRSAVAAHYSAQIFKQCCCDPNGRWAAQLLSRHRVAHSPIHHLLMMDFLDLRPEESSATLTPPRLFELGPYPCLNRVCKEYGRPTISSFSAEYSRHYRKSIGKFACADCDHVYVRIAPDSLGNTRSHPTFIASYGILWEETLAANWLNRSSSLRSIAVKLGVDATTVKRHAYSQKLPFPRMGPRTTQKGRAIYLAKGLTRPRVSPEARRRRWLTLRQRHPFYRTDRLRKREPATYAWLYRCDRQWLKQNVPARVRKHTGRAVDWKVRDAQISRRVVRAADELRRRQTRRVRVSVASLERELRVSPWLTKHLSKLPITASKIATMVENREQFAIRRLRITETTLRNSGLSLPRWLFLRSAGIRADLLASPLVENTAEKCMARLSRDANFQSKKRVDKQRGALTKVGHSTVALRL